MSFVMGVEVLDFDTHKSTFLFSLFLLRLATQLISIIVGSLLGVIVAADTHFHNKKDI
jgi:hypothetical protein